MLFEFTRNQGTDKAILDYMQEHDMLKSLSEEECEVIKKANSLVLRPVVDKNGRQTRRWMSVVATTLNPLRNPELREEPNVELNYYPQKIADNVKDYMETMDADQLGSIFSKNRHLSVESFVNKICNDFTDDPQEWKEQAEAITGSKGMAEFLMDRRFPREKKWKNNTKYEHFLTPDGEKGDYAVICPSYWDGEGMVSECVKKYNKDGKLVFTDFCHNETPVQVLRRGGFTKEVIPTPEEAKEQRISLLKRDLNIRKIDLEKNTADIKRHTEGIEEYKQKIAETENNIKERTEEFKNKPKTLQRYKENAEQHLENLKYQLKYHTELLETCNRVDIKTKESIEKITKELDELNKNI